MLYSFESLILIMCFYSLTVYCGVSKRWYVQQRKCLVQNPVCGRCFHGNPICAAPVCINECEQRKRQTQ